MDSSCTSDEAGTRAMEQVECVQVHVDDERHVDKSKRRAAFEEMVVEEVGPQLIVRILEGSERPGNPIAIDWELEGRYDRSPVLEKRFVEPHATVVPPVVRKIIFKLGSENAPQSLKLKDLQGRSFGILFGGKHGFKGSDHKWGNLSANRVATIRLMLIAAMGNCPNLRTLNLGNSHKLPRFHLTLRELEELLEPLQSSQAIMDLNLDGHEILETEAGCRVLGRFLMNNRTLETLHIFDSNLDYHIIQSLVSSSHPTLRTLHLYLNPTEDGVFDTVRGILQACPRLQEMPSVEWRCDNEEDAERWADVLMRHSSFDAVEIAGPVGSLGVFLRRILDSTCQLCAKKTLRKVKMMSLDDQFQRMPEQIVSLTVSANRYLETLDLAGICISSEDWQEVFRTLRHNAVLRNLQLEDMQQGFDSEAWKELGALVEASSKLQVLKIHDPCKDVPPRSVEYIFRSLQSNRSVRKVKLIMFGHEIDNDGVSALAKALEMNDVLEHLALDGFVIRNLEAVFRSLRKNSTLRELGLCSCKGFNDEAYRELLGVLQINSAVRKINLSHTNWTTDGTKEGRWATSCEGMQVSERRDHYMSEKLNFVSRQ